MSGAVARVSLRLGISLLAFALVVSCGGGGGGGGGGSSSSGGGGNSSPGVRFTLNPSSVSATYFQNEGRPLMQATATASGSLPAQIYIGAVDEGTSIDPQITVSVSGQQATFQMNPKAGLAPGVYTGRLKLMACTTSSCTKQVGNSPVYLPYTITVRQDLIVSPEQDTYSGESGTDIVVPLTVTLPEGGTSFDTQVISQDNICSTADVTANSLKAVLRSLPSGNYSCTFIFTSGTRIVQRVLSFTMTPPAGGEHDLSASPTYFTQATSEGAMSDPQLVDVTPASWDSRYDYLVQYGSGALGWLKVTKTANGYSVVSDATDLSQGTYGATLRIFGVSPAGYSDTAIALTVGPGLVQPADRNIVVSSDTKAEQLQGSVTIDMNAGPAIDFTAMVSSDWLTLEHATGQTGGSFEFHFDTAPFRALPNGQVYTAEVVVTSSHENVTPVTFKINVDKRIGEVTGIGPYLQTAGQPLRFYVRGKGLSLPADIASRLQLDGITGANITTVSDTALLVTAPARAAGQHVVSMTNALGLTMPTSTLKIIEPVTNDYSAIPTGVIPRSVLFDAEHQTLFWAGQSGAQTLHALRKSGSTWGDFPVGATDAVALGITHDGASILAGDGATLRFLDSSTLSFQKSAAVPYDPNYLDLQNAQIPVTNDGLIWYRAPDVINDNYLGHYDPPTGTQDVIRVFITSGSGRIPRLHVNRDGELLTLGDAQQGGTLHSSNLEAGVEEDQGYPITSASDDGSRILVGWNLFARNLGALADVAATITDADSSRAPLQAVVSPDGQRVYVLSYDTQDYFNVNDPLPAPASTPRIHVLDATFATVQSHLPILGSFDIDEFPTCRIDDPCGLYTVGTISPDGKTLFFAGSENLVVVPVPDESTLQQKMRRTDANYGIGPGGARMYPWKTH